MERRRGDCGMLKIAVVEDQQEVRDELCRFIRQYAAENSLQVEVLPVEEWGRHCGALRAGV